MPYGIYKWRRAADMVTDSRDTEFEIIKKEDYELKKNTMKR